MHFAFSVPLRHPLLWASVGCLCGSGFLCEDITMEKETLKLIIFSFHSIQLPLLDTTLGASVQTDIPEFPAFPLPPQPGSYCTVLSAVHMERFREISLTKAEAEDIELNTRQQNNNLQWHHARSSRLTSSLFKRIVSRRSDFQQLAAIMSRKKKNVVTKAMRRGLELEPAAASKYAAITGNTVKKCGFVINPNAPHLGTSPDRRVRSGEGEYGLLEIKCPNKSTYTDCQYLQIINDTYKLNRTHDYYTQIMGKWG